MSVCLPLSDSPQCQALKAVEREPYEGDVAVMHSGKKDCGPCDGDTPTRPHTKHGGQRDLHESSFSLSGNTHCITLQIGILSFASLSLRRRELY